MQGLQVTLCFMKIQGKLPLSLEGMLGHHSIYILKPLECDCMIVFISSSPAQSGKVL